MGRPRAGTVPKPGGEAPNLERHVAEDLLLNLPCLVNHAWLPLRVLAQQSTDQV